MSRPDRWPAAGGVSPNHSRITTTLDTYGNHAQEEELRAAIDSLNGGGDESEELTLEQQVAALQEQVAKLTAGSGLQGG